MQKQPVRHSRGRFRTFAFVAGAIALVAAGWRLWLPRTVSSPAGVAMGRLPGGLHPDDLNLLIITLDTTRADRIDAYGVETGVTPTLDRIAHEGVLFEHAVAPAPLTLPAHSS